MKAAIEKENKDKSRNVGFAVTTRQDTAVPSITVKNTFQPSDYKDGDMPHYAASTTTLAGYIYNPRGSVTVESKNGDVYNDGTIYAGTVDMKVENGDFIQSPRTRRTAFSTSAARRSMIPAACTMLAPASSRMVTSSFLPVM